MAETQRPPTGKELEKVRADRFGNEPGAVRVDTDPRDGKTTLVFVDEAGEETGREPWGEQAGEGPPAPDSGEIEVG